MTLTVRPGRDIVADLQLANRLNHDDWDAGDESSHFWSPKLPDNLGREPQAATPPRGRGLTSSASSSTECRRRPLSWPAPTRRS